RRLQACALGMQAPVFVFRPEAALQRQASAAPLRLAVRPQDAWGLRVEVLKRRGPALDEALLLQAVPPALAPVLAARLLQTPQPTPLVQEEPQKEPRDATLARPARQRVGA
ncbi:MAG TPA: hypothetical protein VJN44_08895, partial [Roseateles sp.]|nr:hypothetical protein [Roseateles sp.]